MTCMQGKFAIRERLTDDPKLLKAMLVGLSLLVAATSTAAAGNLVVPGP